MPISKWSGPDCRIGKCVRQESENNLAAYSSQPGLVVEHAYHEEDTTLGGYAGRQIVELVQNAADQLTKGDDSSRGQILIRLTSAALYVADDGGAVDQEGVRSLLLARLPTKGHRDEIGRFGVGFKSVLGVTDRPGLFSRSGSLVFDRKKATCRISRIVPNAKAYPTLRVAEPVCPSTEASKDEILKVLMGWAVNIIRLPLMQYAYSNLSEQMRGFRAEFLLFVPHVRRLEMIWDPDIDDCDRRTIGLDDRDNIYYLKDSEQSSQWKLFSYIHRLSKDAKVDRRSRDVSDEVSIVWAFPLDRESTHYHFWAFFPTQTLSLLLGIFQASWKTNEDRKNLLEGRFNDELIDVAATLVADRLPELSTTEDPGRHLDALGARAEYWLNYHAKRMADRVYSTLHSREVVPDLSGRLRCVDEVSVFPQVDTGLTREWESYEHCPLGWLHMKAMSRNRLAIIGRISARSADRSKALEPASVSAWLEALTTAGRQKDDSVRASKVAIQIAAKYRNGQGTEDVGRIVLRADHRWARPILGEVYLSGTDGVEPGGYVHQDIESDQGSLIALKALGVTELSPVVEFAKLVRSLRWAGPTVNFDNGWWERFWELAHEIGGDVALATVRSEELSPRSVKVCTVDNTWHEIRHVLFPGRIAPADGSRDAPIAVNIQFHSNDHGLLMELGVRDRPVHNYRFDFENLASIGYQGYRSRCESDYRRRDDLPHTPQLGRVGFKEYAKIGPMDAFLRLSDEGKAKFTDELLQLRETYQSWTMNHQTSSGYPPVPYQSGYVVFLQTNGRVQVGSDVYPFRDGLGEKPKNRDVQRWLLEHPNTLQIREAFDDLSTVSEVFPIGDDEPVPIADEWPGLRGRLDRIDRIQLIRCDRLVDKDGREVPTDCARIRDDVYLVRHDDGAHELRAVLRELPLCIDEDSFRRMLRRETAEDVHARRQRVAEHKTDAERLLEAVGDEALQTRLPSSLISILDSERNGLTGVMVAEAAIATYHTGALREYRDYLDHLNPPVKWAGSVRAVEFVCALGFGVEWAGRRTIRRRPYEDVTGPYRLPRLHRYQKKAVANLRELLGQQSPGNENRGLLSLPTGSGKTRVAVEAIIDAIREDSLKGTILWVADRDELCEQAVASWQQAWSAVGPEAGHLRISRMWGGQQQPAATHATQVVVATIQTLNARGVAATSEEDPLRDVRLLVVDEAHGSIAPRFTSLMNDLGLTRRRSEEAICLLGLTATPYRGHNEEETRRLANRYGENRLDSGLFDSDDAKEVISQLQNMGVLAGVDHQTIRGADETLGDEELRGMETLPWLPEAVERRIAGDTERTHRIIAACEELICRNWPTLIFATSVEHAATVSAMLQLRGVTARAVSGATDTTVRRSIVDEFRAGRVKVLVNYGVFREGFDAPKTRAIVVARPVYSPNLYFQMIGRGLRGSLNGGTDRCLILDVKDNIRNYDRALAFSELDWLWNVT